MNSAIFLDRDGVLNQLAANGGYVTKRKDWRWIPGVLGTLAFLSQHSHRKIVVVTNQACIGKMLVTRKQVDDLHVWMQYRISEAGGWTDGVYVCPHAPTDGCDCRKPKPGLLIRAAKELNIDLSRSVMVGDTGSDLQAGWAAGVPECYQVRTGAPLKAFLSNGHEYDLCATLIDVARMIVRKETEEAYA